MSDRPHLLIDGLDSGPEAPAAVLRSRLIRDVQMYLEATGLREIKLVMGTPNALSEQLAASAGSADQPPRPRSNTDHADEPSIEARAKQYLSISPLFASDQLILPAAVAQELDAAVGIMRVEKLVFDQWGLREIEPFPKTALNFHGAPGTGKTLAAHAIANTLGRRILVASYAEIESKFHGDGPKNVKALFFAAQRDNAILFIDEADSLLSKRLTNVSQGSEQAINSMRSQLLICLEQHRGVVVFATNLVENYDHAFETRVRHIHFPMPDAAARSAIWRRHLPKALPLDADVHPDTLGSTVDDVCGRDIRNAVIDAATRVALRASTSVSLTDLVSAIQRLKAARIREHVGTSRPLTEAEAHQVEQDVAAALDGRPSSGKVVHLEPSQ